MDNPTYSRWLHRFAILTAAATALLLLAGGEVTSTGSGMAVPDWPQTFGQNMFLFPVSKWIGGVFYEHVHRLIGAAVGLMTLILAVWFWVAWVRARRDGSRPRILLPLLGVIALEVVCIQGLLGGLRVVENSMTLAMVHGVVAQLFFCLMVAIALFTSKWWLEPTERKTVTGARAIRTMSVVTVLVCIMQLTLGVMTRQTLSALAIPDFPLSYHKLMPPMDEAGVLQANEERQAGLWNLPANEPIAVSARQIRTQFEHRFGSLLVTLCVLIMGRMIWKRAHNVPRLKRVTVVLLLLLLAQLTLGASIIWTKRATDVATAHVVVGALTFAAAVAVALCAYRLLAVPKQEEAVAPDAKQAIA